MSSNFGNNVKFTIFGQSHSEAIGIVIDGLPAGKRIDMGKLSEFTYRRSPSKNVFSTTRKETDTPNILSGMIDNVTCGAPLCAIFENRDTRSKDYDKLRDIPRPAHADYPAHIKHKGFNDIRGGGHFSARLTAPLCFAGGICAQLLEEKGIYIGAHIASIGPIKDDLFDPVNVSLKDFENIKKNNSAVLNSSIEEAISSHIIDARLLGDSIGGSIECCILGMPTGIGEPMFDGLENRICSAIFAVPAVKGIEFGAGFNVCSMRGSENNDEFYMDGDTVKTRTNNHGGILGGLSSGMPIIFRVAMKPTPSIHLNQKSISISKRENTDLVVEGRHDTCIVPRAVPCIESATAIAIYDMLINQ